MRFLLLHCTGHHHKSFLKMIPLSHRCAQSARFSVCHGRIEDRGLEQPVLNGFESEIPSLPGVRLMPSN